MKISLIVCAHNEEKYIETCLAHAIKNSDGKFCEIIVINNASTDNTKKVCEKFKEVIVIDENKKGLIHARQRGYKKSKGEILAFIDADTEMPPYWTARVLNEFSINNNLSCLSGPYHYYDIPEWQQFLVWLYWLIGYLIYRVVGYMITGGNFAIRKSVLDKMNGFDTNIEFYGEDTDIARRAHKFGKVKFNMNLTMPISGRRLLKQGLTKTTFLYALNFFSEILIKKPITKNHVDFR